LDIFRNWLMVISFALFCLFSLALYHTFFFYSRVRSFPELSTQRLWR
jgi:hypothetical protein